ncbi:MAG TPA: hypothetical protein DDZ51_19615 [Planctomycetaceae bacterium]|nr:hypothetical protein [Planctomycetaceae bacterium]
MRAQHLQQSYTSRYKLAALLAFMSPGLAFADDTQNSLRQREASSIQLGQTLQSSKRQKMPLAIEEVDGWVSRVGRSPLISPLVIDPSSTRPQYFAPVPRLSIGTGPLVVLPDSDASSMLASGLVGPVGTASINLASRGDGSAVAEPQGSVVAMKIGQSGSSTLTIVPNVLAPVPRSVDLQPENPAEPIAGSDSLKPAARVAMAKKSESAIVDNPEQNEPTGELPLDDLAARDAIPEGESDAVLPEVSDVEMEIESPGMSKEPLATDEAALDPSGDNGTDLAETAIDKIADSQRPSDTTPADAGLSVGDGKAVGPSPMEIRKLRLRDDFPGGGVSSLGGTEPNKKSRASSESPGAVELEPLDPSIAKMRVGDVEPRVLGEYESQESEGLVQPLPRSLKLASGNPIQGDMITSAGEMVLALGQPSANRRLQPQTARLKPMIERTLKYYWDHPEDAAERTHWGMMHSIMVFDRDTQIVSRRQRFNAVAWMAGNNPCRNQTLFSRDEHGILPKTGVGLQGHQAQLLAIFGLIDVPLNYPVYASKQKYTVNDILLREMRDCKVKTELTFTLIGLAHYADTDSTWVSGDGQDWSVPRVIQEELSQPIVGAACGGTHRLMGFGHALRRRQAEGKSIDGQWERADRYVKDFVAYTWSLQNRDGSMSTAWYEKPEDNGDIDRKIQTTGHMLEMLMTVTPDTELQTPEMLRTVNFMATTLYAERGHEWQIGPKGHALRSLVMYYQRVFGTPAPWRAGSGSRSAGASTGRTVR